ncbi:MAG TPA: hypothetical protein DHV26_10110 [Cytophagales bacterium]|nr:hypothetical protein [Cytophagales bacterium]HRG10150.1 CPBP family glutamic-type intramembrane protease [Cyclobacteriaceae bacterium]
MKITLSFIFLVLLSPVFAQSRFTIDHTSTVKVLTHAKDSAYRQLLDQYDVYLIKNPDDPEGHVQRCRFILGAYADEYEDYNPKYDEAEACARSIIEKFPEDPSSLLFATEFIYGDSARTFLKALELKIEANPQRWTNYDWQVYEQLAQNLQLEDEHSQVIQYAKRAILANDTLDLSMLIATAYKNLNQKDEAIAALTERLDSTSQSWELSTKATLLLELGAKEVALKVFQWAAQDTSGYTNPGLQAKAMIDNGLVIEARDFLLRDYKRLTWNSVPPLVALLEYDLKYSSADSTALTYSRLVEQSFWYDAFAIYRIRLLLKSPFIGWTWPDLGRFTLLFILAFTLLVVPYIWILPMHYWGWWQRSNGRIFQQPVFSWGLRHLWIVCSLWLVCDFMSLIIVDYPGFLSSFTDISGLEYTSVSRETANITLLFFTGCLVFTLGIMKRSDFIQFFTTSNGIGSAIAAGFGLALALRVALVLYSGMLKAFGIDLVSDTTTISPFLSITDSIISVNQQYSPYLGFIMVVILVPFYEEVLFRGVFLSAAQRNMNFIVANCLQSLVFAIAHQQLKLIPFYFAFGLVAGIMQRKSNGLVISTAMHITNNLIAFVFILYRG